MAGPVLVFGHEAPLGADVLCGCAFRDVTRQDHGALEHSRAASFLEPFLDPFVRSFIYGLERGAFDHAHAILVWRRGGGALHAFRYACELRRLGILPPGPPLHLWNAVDQAGPAASAFNAAQAARLASVLAGADRMPVMDRDGALEQLALRQVAKDITGAEAFRRRMAAREDGTLVDLGPSRPASGPRLALAGSPLGDDALHRWLDRQGALVLDLQGPDAPKGELATQLTEGRVETLVWQVDPHDDLHGWRMPRLRSLCERLGVRFVDLGFVPTWPDPDDLPKVLP